MSTIRKTYSQRQKELANQGKADVYQYTELPEKFSNQVYHLITGCYGSCDYGTATKFDWDGMVNIVVRELGISEFGPYREDHPENLQIFLKTNNSETLLDFIELAFNILVTDVRKTRYAIRYSSLENITIEIDEGVEELNRRFKENGIGYQFENGELIRIDSQFIHAEAVKPAINLLAEEGFDNASEEFFKAYEHFRKGDNEEAITLANSALESTLKTICTKKNWAHNSTDTAKPLIEVVVRNGLIPQELQETLVLSTPRIRNKFGAHGKGAQPINVPDYLASFALHHTASNIVYLVSAYRAIK